MSEGQPKKYKVGRLPHAVEQIRSLGVQAKETGKLDHFVSIITTAVFNLENDPLSWGDPYRHTWSPDGVVYLAIIRPIAFDYVVYEQKLTVVLLDVRAIADVSE